jgi:DNA-binding SARP family transcriptional activator
MSTLCIRLFGPLQLERDGRPLPNLPARRVGDLLAYLCLNRETLHTRERLAGLLWADADEDRARHSLNTALWRLQRVLRGSPDGRRPYLRVSPQAIGFNTDSDCWLDVAEFESRCALAAQAEDPSLYEQAVALYRGDLLPECYEDWCVAERERLQGMYIRALERLVKLYARNDEPARAVEFAGRILACDPLREEVHRALIRLHLRSGQPTSALRQYRACEEVLRRELGIEPARETRALLPRIFAAHGDATRAGSGSASASGFGCGPGAGPASGLRPDLDAAVARLRDASAICEQAQARLVEAVTALERLMRQAGHPAADHASEPGQAGRQIATAMSQLQTVAS